RLAAHAGGVARRTRCADVAGDAEARAADPGDAGDAQAARRVVPVDEVGAPLEERGEQAVETRDFLFLTPHCAGQRGRGWAVVGHHRRWERTLVDVEPGGQATDHRSRSADRGGDEKGEAGDRTV